MKMKNYFMFFIMENAHTHPLTVSSFFLQFSQDNRRSILASASAVYDGDSGGGDGRENQDINQEDLL